MFLNPPDIGGRYSALTYVGLVPASLLGLDLDALLGSATAMAGACRSRSRAATPGCQPGLALGTLALGGRDKLTFLADPEIASFGAWAEQLIAESTGKRGVGHRAGRSRAGRRARAYGADRVFVRLHWRSPTAASGGAATTSRRPSRRRAIRSSAIELPDPMDIGAEFVRWEVATAIAGAVLGIDPFDQPNVEEAKEHTRRLLAARRRATTAPTPPRRR